MTRAAKHSRKKSRKTPAPAPAPAISTTDDDATPAIVEHPDGYYWIGIESDEEFGPYETYELAQAARDAVDEDDVAPGNALAQAEREIGIADWIDAQTGEPAEGQSPPHLEEE